MSGWFATISVAATGLAADVASSSNGNTATAIITMRRASDTSSAAAITTAAPASVSASDRAALVLALASVRAGRPSTVSLQREVAEKSAASCARQASHCGDLQMDENQFVALLGHAALKV